MSENLSLTVLTILDNIREKIPFILSQILLTVLEILLIWSETASLFLPKSSVTSPLTNSKALPKDLLINSHISLITSNTEDIYSPIVLSTAENFPSVLLSIQFSAFSKTCTTASQTIEKMSIRLLHITSAAFVIFSQICDKWSPISPKFPVTKSIKIKIGPSTTFLISSQAASAVTLIFSQTSDIISIKGSNISTNASAALFQTSFIQSHTAIAASNIASQVACINALISSQYLKIIAAIATTAAVIRTTGNDIAPASIPKNPMIALTTVTIAVNPPIICGMNPITIRSGPTISIIAPATAANIPIASLVL